MLHQCIPSFRLQTDIELSLLRVEYRVGPESTPHSVQLIAILDLARKHAIRNLLIDMRTMPLVSVHDELWLGKHFMPALVALPLQRLVLIIGSHQTYHQLTVDALYELMKPAIRFDAQFFDDPETALDWLTDNASCMTELLAEWDNRLA